MRLLDSPLPIVAAPMAGGPTTVALAEAVGAAGAYPFLAGGYKSSDALATEIEQLRPRVRGFGVNLFVPSRLIPGRTSFAAYAEELRDEAAAHGVRLDAEPVIDDDHWHQKLRLLIERPVPTVSLTFGLPDAGDIAALRRAGTRVLASVTSADEARLACAAGVDGLIVQGPDAGGHSAVFDPSRIPEPTGTASLVRRAIRASGLPVIAAGGVDGPEAVSRLLAAGAEAVAVGTLLLRTDEAGTSPTHRAALADPAFEESVITRAFTGRPARALRNGFIDRHGSTAPNAYPAVHHLTRELRAAAARSGDTDRLHLWAGTGYRSASEGPAAEVVRRLAAGV